MPVFNFKEWLTNLLNENFKTQREKFIKQGIRPAIVDSYINDFKGIREKKYAELSHDIHGLTVPIPKRNDIDAYPDFHQLEIVVDYIKGQREVKTKVNQDVEVDGKPIYKDNGLEIYYADSPNACVKIRGDRPYSWCIARNDGQNMYGHYRFSHNEPTFYFVKNIEKTKQETDNNWKDPYHFFVVQVRKDNSYVVTSAKNDGDQNMSWNDIVKVEPKLNGLQNYFKSIPLEKGEKKQYEKFSEGIGDEEFKKLTYKEKSRYLDIYGTVTDSQFNDLPDDLKNKYLSLGKGLTDHQYESIKDNKALKKRYSDMILRKIKTPKVFRNLTSSEKTLFREFVENVLDSLIKGEPVETEKIELAHRFEYLDFAIMKKINKDEKIPGNIVEDSIKEILGNTKIDGDIINIEEFNKSKVLALTYAVERTFLKLIGYTKDEDLKEIFLSKVTPEMRKDLADQYHIPKNFLNDDDPYIFRRMFKVAATNQYKPLVESFWKSCYNVKNDFNIYTEPTENNKVIAKINLKDFSKLYVHIATHPDKYSYLYHELESEEQQTEMTYGEKWIGNIIKVLTKEIPHTKIGQDPFYYIRKAEAIIKLDDISSENLYRAWIPEVIYRHIKKIPDAETLRRF